MAYNLVEMQLEIKADRKKDLIEEIDTIISSGLLDPGSAGKLKGKLMFGASQLWGKIGRVFYVRSLSGSIASSRRLQNLLWIVS